MWLWLVQLAQLALPTMMYYTTSLALTRSAPALARLSGQSGYILTEWCSSSWPKQHTGAAAAGPPHERNNMGGYVRLLSSHPPVHCRRTIYLLLYTGSLSVLLVTSLI